jgi:aminopeptidase S
VNISSFAGQTIRILIQAADASTASLVEAAVDNVTITRQ